MTLCKDVFEKYTPKDTPIAKIIANNIWYEKSNTRRSISIWGIYN